MSGIALEKEALKLSAEEKAAIDQAWLAESKERLEAFRKGNLEALDGEATLKSIESELH